MSNITSKILSNEKKNCVSRKIVQFNLLELIHLLKKPTHSSTSFPRPKFPSKRRVSTTFLHLWSETVCLSCPTRHSDPKSIISFGKSHISGHLQSHISQVQLNEYEREPYFLQFFQSNRTICLIIHVFCKSCESELVLTINK